MQFLKKHAEGATESSPDYWYGVVENTSGTIWHELFYSERDARKCADDLGGGSIVILAVRALETDDGEYWPLPVRNEKAALAEAEAAVDEAREVFEAVIGTNASIQLTQDVGAGSAPRGALTSPD